MPGTPEPDHYTVLGVQRAASGHDIKAAFKRLAKAYHPDKNADGEALFKEVSAAYEVLGDEGSREEYDRDQACRRCSSFNSPTPPPSFAGGDPFDEVRRRADEDAQKLRRREPISAYLFVGREKELFDEMLEKDTTSKARKTALRYTSALPTDDLKAWSQSMDRLNREEDAACRRKAADRMSAEDNRRQWEESERARRMEEVRRETQREWEREVARLDEEKRIERDQREERLRDNERRELERQADYDDLFSGHQKDTVARKRAAKIAPYLDKRVDRMSRLDLQDLQEQLAQWMCDVSTQLNESGKA